MSVHSELAKQSTRSLAREIGPLDREVLQELLSNLLAACGEQSLTKKATLAILRSLIRSEGRVRVLAPCCPDYSHDGRVYTFRGLGRSVSLLCQRQIQFAERIAESGISADVVFAYADIEAEDPVLRQMAAVTEEEFLGHVDGSVSATQQLISNCRWSVTYLSKVVPEFPSLQREKLVELRGRMESDSSFRTRIVTDTMSRRALYDRIGARLTPNELIERTLRTAAQYLILGEYAAQKGMLVANHTTVNLSWYAQAGTGVLHNPVAIY